MVTRTEPKAQATIGPGWRERVQRAHAPVLRYGVALVFLWFGIAQLTNVGRWVGWVPQWITEMGVSAESAVIANGLFELIGSILLLLGLATRTVAGLLALHMTFLVLSIGLTAIGVRDFAILLGALVVFLHGPDVLCLERLVSKDFLTGS